MQAPHGHSVADDDSDHAASDDDRDRDRAAIANAAGQAGGRAHPAHAAARPAATGAAAAAPRAGARAAAAADRRARTCAAPAPRQPSPPGRSPWYRDVVGDVLVAGGAVSIVVGAVLYRGAVSDLDEAEGASTHDAYVDLVDGARTKRLYAVALVGGGVALAGAGVLRFVMRGRRTEARRVAISPARGGGLVTWSRSF